MSSLPVPAWKCEEIRADVQAGMSQTDAAQKHGVSQGFVCKMLGRCTPGKFPPYTNQPQEAAA